MKALLLSSIVIFIVCSITLLVYRHANHYKRMDRFFYEKNMWLYILLQFCYYLLFVSLILNGRFLVYIIIEFAVWKFYGVKLNLIK